MTVSADDILEALRFSIDLMTFRECQEIETEPHTFTTSTMRAELVCHGCSAHGFADWPEWSKKSFIHEPGCRYVRWRDTLNQLKIAAPFGSDRA